MRHFSAVFVVVALLAIPAPSLAQGTSILPADAEAGDRLTVRTTTGQTFSGRLVSDSSGALVLTSRDGERRIGHADVASVNRRRNRILFGPLIGLAAGVAAGIPLSERSINETGDGTRELVTMVGIGVGVGTIVDLFTRSDRTIYRKGGSLSEFVLEPRKNGARVGWTRSW